MFRNNTGNGVLEIVNAIKLNYQMSGSGETTYTGSAVEFTNGSFLRMQFLHLLKLKIRFSYS